MENAFSRYGVSIIFIIIFILVKQHVIEMNGYLFGFIIALVVYKYSRKKRKKEVVEQ